MNFWSFMPFSDFYLIFLFNFFFTKIVKKGVYYLQVLTWRAGSPTSWHVVRGTTAQVRRGTEAMWQSCGWPTRGVGGAQCAAMWQGATRPLTRRNREVVNFKWYRVKNNTELTNFENLEWIEWHNGKYGSNPQGIKQFLDVIFKFDQIGQEIDGRNWEKWYFKKEDFKSIPRNKKSLNLDLISRRNQDSKWREISDDQNRDFGWISTKLTCKS